MWGFVGPGDEIDLAPMPLTVRVTSVAGFPWTR